MILQVFLYIVVVTSTLILSDNLDNICDTKGILIYEDLGCIATYDNGSKCPIKFSCEGLRPSKTNCYFRGKSYTERQTVDNNFTYPECEVGCSCLSIENRAQFDCAELDCGEWLGVPVKLGCYRKYSLDSCCSVGEICPPFDGNEKCVVDGEEYKEGEEFFPKNTCLKCICGKGFKGKFEEPFCKRRKCGAQLRGTKIQDTCAAFYDLNSENGNILCCPNDWICPDGSEKIIGESKSENICKFGNKMLKVGQSFERKNHTGGFGQKYGTVKCECVVPPLVKCTNVKNV